jgi:hypothetical protein
MSERACIVGGCGEWQSGDQMSGLQSTVATQVGNSGAIGGRRERRKQPSWPRPPAPRPRSRTTSGDGPQRTRAANPSRGNGPHTGRRPAQPCANAHPDRPRPQGDRHPSCFLNLSTTSRNAVYPPLSGPSQSRVYGIQDLGRQHHQPLCLLDHWQHATVPRMARLATA